MILTDYAIKNRMTVAVLIFAVVLLGAVSYVSLPREAAPDVPVPFVLVTTTYQGVSPQDIETTLTMKIEEKLGGLKGLKEIRSQSLEGMSFISIEFQPTIKVDDAMQYVRDKVDQAKGDLPRDADEPVLTEINIAELPIMQINIAGPVSPVVLKAIADELKDRINPLPGVLDCEVQGNLEPETRLEFDPYRVAGYGISVPALMSLIPNENVNVSAGGLETPGTKFGIRVPGEFEQPKDIGHIQLTVRDGKPIYLGEVARVRETFKDRETYSRLDGQPSVSLNIKKRVGANILQVADEVKAVLAEARSCVPASVVIDTTFDRSDNVNMMVSDLENSILTGMVLVVGVLMLFMGLRDGADRQHGHPAEHVDGLRHPPGAGHHAEHGGAVQPGAGAGHVGRRRHRDRGERLPVHADGLRAAGGGAQGRRGGRLAGDHLHGHHAGGVRAAAVLGGIIGSFMKYLPITVCVVMSCSLFMVLVVNPVIICAVGRVKGAIRSADYKNAFQRVYMRVLRLSLRHRAATLIVALLCLVGIGVLYNKYGHGMDFMPKIDPKQATISLRAPQGTNVSYTDLLARLVEAKVRSKLDATGDLKHLSANVGASGGGGLGGLGGQSVGPNTADLTLVFQDYLDRRRPSQDAVEELRVALAGIPGTELEDLRGARRPAHRGAGHRRDRRGRL